MKYKTENEIKSLVKSFENGTISRKDWRHAEHLAVGLYYVWNFEFDVALTKMRDGIFKLLRAFEVDLNKEMPYHETLTVFWLKTVFNYKKANSASTFLKTCNEIVEKFDKNYPLKFYSRELLFSEEARSRFIEPDLSIQNNYFLANSE